MEPQTTQLWEGDEPPPHLTPLERLPSELLFSICDHLPIESRVVLSMTSRTMKWKVGHTFESHDLHDEDAEVLREREQNKENINENKRDNDRHDDDWWWGYEEWWEENEDMWVDYQWDRWGEDKKDNNDDGFNVDYYYEPHPRGSGSSPPTPHMSILALLERDTLEKLHTRCGYCRTVHPATCPVDEENNDWRLCRHAVNRAQWLDGSITISLPLVRAAVLLAEGDLANASQLASVLAGFARTTVASLPASKFRYLVDHQARVANGCLMLRKQLFIARNGILGTKGSPSARDLAALNHILNWGWGGAGAFLWVPHLGNDLDRLSSMKTAESSAALDIPWSDEYKWYRTDIGPAPNTLAPRLQCLLTHPMPCLPCAKTDDLMGRVKGNRSWFVDHSVSAVPLPNNPWGRVVVFTSWVNIGAGEWPGDGRWTARPVVFESVPLGYREDIGSRVGDICEAYEGLARDAPYIPPLLPHIVEQLVVRGGKGKEVVRGGMEKEVVQGGKGKEAVRGGKGKEVVKR